MKIYTHWVNDPVAESHTKKFFSTKGEEEKAAKASEKDGKNVIARHDWNVEPNAKAVVEFCREQMSLREYMEIPESDEEEIAGLL